MNYRTDLAIESHEHTGRLPDGIDLKKTVHGSITEHILRIRTETAGKRLGKPAGIYITFEGLDFTEGFTDIRERAILISERIKKLLPKGHILVAALGNERITPDAIGVKSASHILATRHIQQEILRSCGLEGLRPVSVIGCGVTGNTGLEVAEIIKAVVSSTAPSAVIAIDALCAGSLTRLGNTVQISDTGIVPGSGIGNRRKALNRQTLGVPVISVGVPTVVDALTLAQELSEDPDDIVREGRRLYRGESMMVTPKETDILCDRAARVVGAAVNLALQGDTDYDTLMALTA